MCAVRTANKTSSRYHGLSATELIGLYRTMVTSRKVDDLPAFSEAIIEALIDAGIED